MWCAVWPARNAKLAAGLLDSCRADALRDEVARQRDSAGNFALWKQNDREELRSNTLMKHDVQIQYGLDDTYHEKVIIFPVKRHIKLRHEVSHEKKSGDDCPDDT